MLFAMNAFERPEVVFDFRDDALREHSWIDPDITIDNFNCFDIVAQSAMGHLDPAIILAGKSYWCNSPCLNTPKMILHYFSN